MNEPNPPYDRPWSWQKCANISWVVRLRGRRTSQKSPRSDSRLKNLMKHAVMLILASCFCTGCMFEAQRAFGCNNVGVFGCKDKVPPPTSHEPPPREAEAGTRVLTNNRDETECLPEQRDVDVCIDIYQPVCATVKVLCVTTPCDPVQETFANSCEACMSSLVSAYTEGACPVDPQGNAQVGYAL
jgi:hypothetical protein